MNNALLCGGFALLIIPLLALDLGLFHRKAHTVTLRSGLIWTGIWVGLALLFACGVFYFRGTVSGMEFLTGYVIEQALSIDNVFLFAVIFTSMQIPPRYQHRVLFWGVISAIVMRGLMIAVGVALIARFHWILYVFGGLLILTGINMFRKRDQHTDPSRNRLFQFLRRALPMTDEYDGQKFITRRNGQRVGTPLLLTLILVELIDVVFAVDSIPAVFSVTRDPFIVFTSNIFAILGLRSLYFVLAGMMDRFHYLKVGLAAILVFIGSKMIGLVKLPIALSLLIIVALIGLSIGASLLRLHRLNRASSETTSP